MNENEKTELLQSIVGAVKEVISPMENDIKDMKDKMDSMENKMDSMENKIDNMETRIDSMETRIDHMETDVKDTKYDVKNMQIQLSSVSYDTRKTKLIVENELRPDIQTLVEGYRGRVEKAREAEGRLDNIEQEIIALKTVVDVQRERAKASKK